MTDPVRRTTLPAAPGGSSRARVVAGEAMSVPPEPWLDLPWSSQPVAAAGPTLDLVTAWMREPHVARHWHQDWCVDAWAEEIAAQLAGGHSRPWLVGLDGEPVAYVEVYRVAADVVGEHIEASPGDLGVHLAIGDPSRTNAGLGTRVLTAVSHGLFAADPTCERVLGDPDAAHGAARSAFASAGFTLVGERDLGHKRAAIMECRRDEVGR